MLGSTVAVGQIRMRFGGRCLASVLADVRREIIRSSRHSTTIFLVSMSHSVLDNLFSFPLVIPKRRACSFSQSRLLLLSLDLSGRLEQFWLHVDLAQFG